MILFDDDMFTLSTGKTFYANLGILGIGISTELKEETIAISEGYDGNVRESFTDREKIEIAEYAISLWKRWAEL